VQSGTTLLMFLMLGSPRRLITFYCLIQGGSPRGQEVAMKPNA